MPTALPRIQVTRTEGVEKLLLAGRARWPGLPAGKVLVRLAEDAVRVAPRSRSLTTFTSTGGTIPAQEIQDILDGSSL